MSYAEIRKKLNSYKLGKRPPRYSPSVVFPEKGSPPYQMLMDDDSEQVMASGPFNSAKTYLSCLKLHRKALYQPGQYAILRKVKETVKGSVCDSMAEVIGYDPMFSKRGYVKGIGGTKPQEYHYDNGSRIAILGMNHPDGFLSKQFHGIYVNQAEELGFDEWELLLSRVRLGDAPQLFGDCNPSFRQHFLNPDNASEITSYKFQHKHNPILWDRVNQEWFPKGEREIAKLKRMTGIRYRRGYLAEWCAAEGVVYEGYDPKKHDVEVRRDDFGSDTEWYLSVDYGFRDPMSVGLWAKTNEVNILYKEIYHTGYTIDDAIGHIDNLLEKNRLTRQHIESCFADHNAEHNEQMIRAGFPITLAEKEVLPGIDLVKQQLEDGLVKFNVNSLVQEDTSLFGKPTRLTDELGAYAYPADNKRKGTQKDEYPIDKHNHGCDMMRYHIKTLESSYADIEFNTFAVEA